MVAMGVRLTKEQSESEAKRLSLDLQRTQSAVQPHNKKKHKQPTNSLSGL